MPVQAHWVRAVTFAGLVALCGCATSAQRLADRREGYEVTASRLGNLEHVSPGAGYDMKWVPIGKGLDYSLSAVEITRFRTDIDACISELAKGDFVLPSEVVRTAQLIACMEPRGWHVAVDEVLVLR